VTTPVDNQQAAEAIGCMTGLDEVESQVNTGTTLDSRHALADAAAIGNPVLRRGGVLATSTGRHKACVSNYSKYWPLLTHPECFPHGTGEAPEHMS
jgi:hypothetical protein